MTKIPEVALETWKDLYAAAVRFADRRLWDRLEDSAIFGVRDPVSGQMGYACVLGALGEMMALCVYRGAEGFDMHRRVQTGEIAPEMNDVIALQNCLMAEFTDREALEKVDREIIKKLGLHFRGNKSWPFFRSHLPGYFPWHLTESEAAFLMIALRCADDVAARVGTGGLDLNARRDHVFSYFPAVAQKENTDFETRWEPYPTYWPEPPPMFVPDPGRLSRIQTRPPKPDSAWEADAFYLPATVTDRDRPYFVRFVLLAQETSGFVIHAGAVEPELPLSQALGEALLEGIEKHDRFPGEVHLRDSALVASLAPLQKALGIRFKTKQHLDKIMDARRHLENAIQNGGLGGVND